jgi:microcystin-dependent protein
MSDQSYLGSISGWGPNFAPHGWAFCQGQTMAISQNSALFSLLGTIYGGDGQTTFMLPNLGGRVPIGASQSPGTSNYTLGAQAGSESTTLTINNMPSHTHATTATVSATLPLSTAAATTATPAVGEVLASASGSFGRDPIDVKIYAPAPGTVQVPLNSSASVTVQPAGDSQPFSLLQPFTAINYIICVQGVFPPRD